MHENDLLMNSTKWVQLELFKCMLKRFAISEVTKNDTVPVATATIDCTEYC